jgi:hypothetical protein
VPGVSFVHQFGIATNRSRHYRQATCHGFQDCIRDTLGERRQDEEVQAAHDLRHVGTLTGKPNKRIRPGLAQNMRHLLTKYPVSDHHKSQCPPLGWHHLQQHNERARQGKLVFYFLHTPNRAYDKRVVRRELGTWQRFASAPCRMKKFGIYTVVHLHNLRSRNSNLVVQVAFQVFRERDILMHERPEQPAQDLVFAIAAVKIVHIATVLAVNARRDSG